MTPIKRMLLGALALLFYFPGVMLAMNVEEISYSNGLHVFVVEDPSSSLVSVRSYVKAGSITEGSLLGAGISHYLEHIVAGGSTKIRSEDDYKDLISKMGGAYNAYTTTDHTSYFINTTPTYLTDAISTIYEWMSGCQFKKSEFDRERDVIIREIERGQANNNRQFYQLSQENFYKYHPLRYPVIGYLDNFKQVKRQDLVDYYSKFYVPSNMIVVIGGPITAAGIRAQLDDSFGKLPAVAPPEFVTSYEPQPSVSRYSEKESDLNVTMLSIRFSTVDLGSPDLYPLDLMDVILSTGEGSILHKTLVEDEKLAYSVSASSFTPVETNGYFDISLDIDYDKKDEVVRRVFEILNSLKSKSIEKYRIERAKKQKLSEDIFSISTIEDKVSRIGNSYLSSGSTHFFDEYVRRFSDVTSDDLKRISNEYFNQDRAVVTLLTPKGVRSENAPSQNMQSLEQTLPEKHTLSNGIRVLLYHDDSLPKTFSRIFLGGGIRAEIPSQNGISNLASDLFGKSSEHYSKEKLQRLIEDNGAHMYASVGYNSFYFSLDIS